MVFRKNRDPNTHPRIMSAVVVKLSRSPETCGASKDVSGIPYCTIKDNLCVGVDVCPLVEEHCSQREDNDFQDYCTIKGDLCVGVDACPLVEEHCSQREDNDLQD